LVTAIRIVPALSTILTIYYVTQLDASSAFVPEWQRDDARRQFGTSPCQNGTPRVTPDEWFRLVELHAPTLREVGVLSIRLEGCEVQLAPNPAGPRPQFPGMDDARPKDPPPQAVELNALDDPETFGGRLPGYTVPATLPLPIEE